MSDVSGWTSGLYATEVRRYRSPARWFHWVTALLIFIIVPLGWMFAEFKTEPDGRFHAYFPGTASSYASVHKTLGLCVLALVVVRLVYRIANRPPALPSRTPVLETALAHATHWLIYIVLLVMPISGYILSSSGKRPISILGLFDFPKLPVSEQAGKTAALVHLSAQWAVYALVLFHVAGVAWHLFVRRDDILARMLPRQSPIE